MLSPVCFPFVTPGEAGEVVMTIHCHGGKKNIVLVLGNDGSADIILFKIVISDFWGVTANTMRKRC